MHIDLDRRPAARAWPFFFAGLLAAGLVSTAAQAAESGSCIADIDQVIARQPTPEMMKGVLPADLTTKLDAASQAALAKASSPGAIVGVRTPQGTWIAAYGKADPKAGTPMKAGIHTRIGSVTKTFTGTVIMRLVQDHLLSLDDPIDKYVPGVPNGKTINLRQLANMTSGVASYTRSTKFTDTYFAKPETVFTPDQLLKVGIGESPLFPPGAQFDYSNTNTVLLGMVIEKVTRRPVEAAFEAMVFKPLKLNNTSWPGKSTAIPAPYAMGFTLQGDTAKPDAPSNATHWNPAWGWTAGELISNIDDLLIYGRALGTGQGLLKPEIQKERLESIPNPAGYGIAFGCIDGWVGHTGELPGYNTALYYHAASDTTVAVQTNSDIASGDCPESPTLTDDPRDTACSSPATRIFAAVTEALGHKFTPIPSK
ncbi:beta-lactamase [Labrys miyagiensis]|uniref:Beta-lactamase n=1 Tax=Labrys miyagiensis TaxID=346912 RepID=A0ABQ6CWY2_9HYPH|nr:serine hydrolase domain-containing protein [Labrys miyagiensis]GLS23530.1 beta-lactamase [Labrys miyagiensis]